MKQFIISAALVLCTMSLTAQDKQLTLDDAMNSGRIIRTRYPNIDLEALDQDTAMPYEDANTKETADTSKGTYSLLFTNTRRVWRYATRGDYYLTNTKSGERRQLGVGLPESSLMFAKISPDGKHVAYVSKNNIYIEDCNMQTPNRRQLTTDGNDTIVNGTFD